MTHEELGRLQFSDDEIETIMGEPLTDATRREALRGRLMAEAEVRKAILTMATQGSTPAQKQMLDLIAARKPNQTKPNQTKPNQTKPNQTKPNQTKPSSDDDLSALDRAML